MGWWSDVLADAIQRSGKLKIVACYTRSEDKRAAFAAKYGCSARRRATRRSSTTARSRRSSTPRRTTCIWKPRAPPPPRASTCSSTSRSPTRSPRGAPSPRPAARRAWCSRSATSGGAKAISAGSADRSTTGVFGRLVNAEANISRDRLGQDRSHLLALHRRGHARRRDAADRHPLHRRARIPDRPGEGGERQIRAAGAARRQSGRREPGPRARERRALDAQRELRLGLRVLPDERLRQGGERVLRSAPGPARSSSAASDAARARSPARRTTPSSRSSRSSRARCAATAQPEMDGERATASLAVIRAGIVSAREGRRVEVAEMLAKD